MCTNCKGFGHLAKDFKKGVKKIQKVWKSKAQAEPKNNTNLQNAGPQAKEMMVDDERL